MDGSSMQIMKKMCLDLKYVNKQTFTRKYGEYIFHSYFLTDQNLSVFLHGSDAFRTKFYIFGNVFFVSRLFWELRRKKKKLTKCAILTRKPLSHVRILIADRLAQLVEHRTAVREVTGSNLDRTNTQSLKITEEKMLPL